MVNEPGTGSDATIYDVARVAGVSPSTVSRAFSRPGRVSAQTAEKIRQVAEELGYRSREVSRTAAKSTTKVLGLAVADITNPFNFRVIRGCQAAAAEAGFVVTLNDAQESEALEREMLRRSLPLLDGLIVASSRLSDTELRTVAKQLPVVILNRRVAGLHCIIPDMAHGVRKATEHLLALDHRNITYLAGPEASWADGMRWRAMRDSAKELGFTEHRVGPFAPTLQGGRGAAEVIAARRLKAVVCFNDLMAIGLMQGLAERGIKVPEQISIIGFDNIFASALVTPGLTTVAAPLTMLGDSAVRYVVASLAGHKSAETAPVSVPVRLIVRHSTGPA
ncbi:LacI family DNA-binding transcriptional regulator [Propioniciclava sp. MC1683]|uniref:LacI family DNA-binding transcriptional regulator n=1 Tax=Propioniciclava sp. MC1683 TaxID=2760309 RepID=UPI0015FF9027|nr:LacI family DNA-binding transcriptional regulator [Propioniciclava sp. MC1683]MBB1500980.1 LacI family DNA-binding transcriptional regulator [Propioniciclava sp. MC1683]